LSIKTALLFFQQQAIMNDFKRQEPIVVTRKRSVRTTRKSQE